MGFFPAVISKALYVVIIEIYVFRFGTLKLFLLRQRHRGIDTKTGPLVIHHAGIQSMPYPFDQHQIFLELAAGCHGPFNVFHAVNVHVGVYDGYDFGKGQ